MDVCQFAEVYMTGRTGTSQEAQHDHHVPLNTGGTRAHQERRGLHWRRR
jgi:hypothetical protein